MAKSKEIGWQLATVLGPLLFGVTFGLGRWAGDRWKHEESRSDDRHSTIANVGDAPQSDRTGVAGDTEGATPQDLPTSPARSWASEVQMILDNLADYHLRSAALRDLIRTAPDATAIGFIIDALRDRRRDILQPYSVQDVVMTWAERYPRKALSRMHELESWPNDRQLIYLGLAKGWVRHDPEEAWRLLTSSLPDDFRNYEYRDIWRAAVDEIALADPFLALRLTEKRDPEELGNYLSAIVRSLAASDPEEAKAFFEQRNLSSDTPGIEPMARELCWTLARRDPELALSFYGGLEPELRRSLAPDIGRMVVHADAGRAHAMAMERLGSDPHDPLGQALFKAWGEQVPEEAVDALRLLPEESRALLAGETAMDNPAKFLFRGVLKEALAFMEPETATQIVDKVMRSVSHEDISLEWLGSLDDTTMAPLWPKVLIDRAREGEAEEVTRLLSRIEDPGDRESTASQVARIWATDDPNAAANWAYELRPEDGDSALRAILNAWDSNDPEGLELWMDAILDPERRERLLLVLARETDS